MISNIIETDWSDDGNHFHPNHDYYINTVSGILAINKDGIFGAYLLNMISGNDLSRSFKNQPCLYLLFYREKLVYVGISNKNVGYRLISHRNDKFKLFDSFYVVYGFQDLNEMMDAEVSLISLNMPDFNVVMHRQLKQTL